ncbi:SemiSWEET family sugar transporter [Flavobacterium aquicola]|uniref:MtN3 and saliva related transmembrane protein n=1 Tax=Flavobacterium aquicola TaxID=1682742 RepID=A0A3E0ECX8_9FLAO|nr:SemiSWEET transporter [Flavobacterium aquicola]REG96107.1 MtN3 and saliva related transmembrane protein [Flavobacterium aquicola]
MDINIIGILAAVFTTAANIPQAYVIIREQSTEHISVTTYIILLTGTLLWVSYGIMKEDWPLIVTNAVTSITSIIIIILNFSSKKVIGKIHRAVLPEKIKKEAEKTKQE